MSLRLNSVSLRLNSTSLPLPKVRHDIPSPVSRKDQDP